MNLFILLSLIISSFSFSQELNECLNPGELLSKSFSHIEGDKVKKKLNRLGSYDIPRNFTLNTKLKTTVYKIYKEDFCKKVSLTKKVSVCKDIDYSVALGKGNSLFKGLFDFRVPLIKRSSLLKNNIAFALDYSDAERLQLSQNLIKDMVNWSIMNAIPQNAKEYKFLVSELQNINQLLREELIDKKNLKSFGFIPPKNVSISEQSGNDKFQNLFNFSIPIFKRARTAKFLFKDLDLSEKQSLKLVKSFSIFANENGIPKSWSELFLLLKFAEEQGTINAGDANIIITDNEEENRFSLGFEAQAKICKIVDKEYFVNKIKSRQTRDFHKSVSKTIKLKGITAPLLAEEKESFQITYDGIKVNLKVSSTNNKYSFTINNKGSQSAGIKLIGTRIKRNPDNTVNANITLIDNKYQIHFQDIYQYLKHVKSTVVEVTLYKSVPIWFDKKIKTFTITLNGREGSFQTQIKKLAKNKKVYVKYSIKRTGEFFTSNSSQNKESSKF